MLQAGFNSRLLACVLAFRVLLSKHLVPLAGHLPSTQATRSVIAAHEFLKNHHSQHSTRLACGSRLVPLS